MIDRFENNLYGNPLKFLHLSIRNNKKLDNIFAEILLQEITKI